MAGKARKSSKARKVTKTAIRRRSTPKKVVEIDETASIISITFIHAFHL